MRIARSYALVVSELWDYSGRWHARRSRYVWVSVSNNHSLPEFYLGNARACPGLPGSGWSYETNGSPFKECKETLLFSKLLELSVPQKSQLLGWLGVFDSQFTAWVTLNLTVMQGSLVRPVLWLLAVCRNGGSSPNHSLLQKLNYSLFLQTVKNRGR